MLLLLTIVSTVPAHVQHSSIQSSQVPPSNLPWVTEPVLQVFNQIQNRIIGLVPGNYTEPTTADFSIMNSIFTLIGTGVSQNDAGSILTATVLARQASYQLLPVNDSATGNKYYVLMENATVNRGWGSYLFSAEESLSTRVILEAPHPITDFNSQEIAYVVFTSTYPSVAALLVSGVERTLSPTGQTDMAHRSQSIFETAHEAVTNFDSVVIQIHSFDAFVHPTEPLVVLSTGDGGLNGAVQSIARNLESTSLSVGIFDGFQHAKLGAENNVQGRYARAFGAGFVHSEISSLVVYNATLITQFENSISQSILSGFRFPAYQIDLKIPIIALSVIVLYFFASFRLSKTKTD